MIGKLTGFVDSIGPQRVIVDVGGVGYVVACSAKTLGRACARTGVKASLLIETHVREDAISLYGFADEPEREAFRLLTTVQGVGAKVALAILSLLGPDDLASALAAQDKTALMRAEGVGPKLALRLITELRDKLGAWSAGVPGIPGAAGSGSSVGTSGKDNAESHLQADALSALTNLGYERLEAWETVAKIAARLGPTVTLPVLIRESLTALAQRGEEGAAR